MDLILTEFMEQDGHQVWVNTARIDAITPTAHGCAIVLAGRQVYVRASVEAVAQRIGATLVPRAERAPSKPDTEYDRLSRALDPAIRLGNDGPGWMGDSS